MTETNNSKEQLWETDQNQTAWVWSREMLAPIHDDSDRIKSRIYKYRALKSTCEYPGTNWNFNNVLLKKIKDCNSGQDIMRLVFTPNEACAIIANTINFAVIGEEMLLGMDYPRVLSEALTNLMFKMAKYAKATEENGYIWTVCGDSSELFTENVNLLEIVNCMDKYISLEIHRPQKGEVWRHFKGREYTILAIATHTETDEEMVIYQANYGDNRIYARPLNMFMSEVDRKKYPDVKERFRFEKVSRKE